MVKIIKNENVSIVEKEINDFFSKEELKYAKATIEYKLENGYLYAFIHYSLPGKMKILSKEQFGL